MMDVKTLSGAAELYREGPHARSSRRGAPVTERVRSARVRCTWTTSRGRARSTTSTAGRQTAHPTRAYASRYSATSSAPCSRHCLRACDPVVGLVVGSYPQHN